MPCTSSWTAARTTSSTERLCPRWTTSAPSDWRIRRMMLIEASWPSNRLAAVTKRTGLVGIEEVLRSRALLSGVVEEAAAGLAAEEPGLDHPAEQRGRGVQ